MDIKLFDSELKVMSVLWRDGDVPAKYIAKQLTEELGWNVNTTYTLIKRCIKRERLNALNRALCAMLLYLKRKFRKQRQMS